MIWLGCAWLMQQTATLLLWLEWQVTRAERWLRRRARRAVR